MTFTLTMMTTLATPLHHATIARRLLFCHYGLATTVHRRSLNVLQQWQRRIIPQELAASIGQCLPFDSSLSENIHFAEAAAAIGKQRRSFHVMAESASSENAVNTSKTRSPTNTIVPPHLASTRTRNDETKRFFFASSTDHTNLLEQAEIHVLPATNDNDDDTSTTQQLLVLAPSGVDLDTVRKVPQLHMARLLVTTTTALNNDVVIHSAKVVNRSLGSTADVCRRLVEHAISSQSKGNVVVGKSTLHGLSDWVIDLLEEAKRDDEFVTSLSTDERQTVNAIARGDMTPFHRQSENNCSQKDGATTGTQNNSRTASELWDQLARLYLQSPEVQQNDSTTCEAALYQSLGGRLVEIEQQADTSDYSNTAGGAMAIFALE